MDSIEQVMRHPRRKIFSLRYCGSLLIVPLASAWVPKSSTKIRSLSSLQVSNPCQGDVMGGCLEDSKRLVQTAFASSVLAGIVLLSPYPSFADVHSPPSISILSTTSSPPPTLQSLLSESTSSIQDADLTDSQPSEKQGLRLGNRQQPQKLELYQPLEEVWTLIDKYYIDRTFGGQNDWKQVRDKYRTLASKAKNDEDKFRVVAEMVATLNDRYSRTIDRAQYSEIQKYDLIGVGVTLMPDANKNIIVGAPPIPGSEAARVGMKEGDYVTAINGIATAGRTAFDIIDQVSLDPSAKTITMTVRSKDSDPNNAGTVLTMARAFSEVKNPIRYKISETRPDGTKVGFVKILEFNALVKGNLQKALAELEAAGANAYVLDIRQNKGGAFQSAVEISSLFTENRIATYVVDSTNEKLPFRTAKGQLAIDTTDPMVIWIDGKSASATEVLAGSLHDNCRAVLMGEPSFGKGLIQAVYGLKNGAGLVLTVARYVTPSGSDIQGVGITPDLGSKDLPFGILGLGSDTSKINFDDIRNRLAQCRIPDELS